MTVMQPRHPHAGSRLTLWAWITVALVPVGLVLAGVVGFAGEGATVAGFNTGGLLAALLALAAPTAAIILGALAAHAGERSGRRAEVVSGLLLVATFVLLPVLIIDFGMEWVAALAVVAVVALTATVSFWSRVGTLRG